MSKYLVTQNNSIRSVNDRDLIIIKKNHLKKLIEGLTEVDQMEFGIKIARFINDIATIQGKLDDIEFKLDLCEHLGFFPKLVDDENYIWFSKKFGSKKFIEAFVYKLINYEPKFEYDLKYTEEAIENNKSLRAQYNKNIDPQERSSTHYCFEFAKIPKEETE
ncbi:MAG: hypothetical protein ACFE9Z_12125 [Promethearchaeota archaeon]